MDEYIDEFWDLIDQAGYTEGLGIVTKFRCGLQRDIQDLIAQLPVGRLEDDKPEEWYAAATQCVENRAANATFHGGSRSQYPPKNNWPSPPETKTRPISVVPQKVTFTETSAVKKEIVCYRCREVGHRKPECPKKFDIRHMMMEECEEWMQQMALDKDTAELPENWKNEEDFPESNE